MTTTPAKLEDLTDTALEVLEEVNVLRRDVNRLRLDLDGLTRKSRVLQRDVDWLRRAMRALLAHQGLAVPPPEADQ